MARNKQNRKERSKRMSKFDIELLNMEHNNKNAREEGPSLKKNWSRHDLKPIKPIGDNQTSMFESYFNGNNIIACGSAGTGKTFIALWLALQSIFDGDPQTNIVIVRSAVPSRDIGFLPGDASEKLAPYELVYKEVLTSLTGRPTAYDNLVELGIIKFMPTSFLRGLTWDKSIIIVDEVQNLTFDEINTVMTRVGKGSRVIVCGDIAQNDLSSTRQDSGFDKFIRVAEQMKSFDRIYFNRHDIVRSGFTKDWIIAKEDCNL